MKEHVLQVEARSVTGHQVKKLRAVGKVPASVYGRHVESVSLTVDAKAFLEVYAKVGETGVIDLALGLEKRPVLVHHVQVHPVDGALLHVEFLQVDLKQKVKAHVPLVLEGESPAVLNGEGVLLTLIDELEVEALPRELPEKIAVNITILVVVGDELKVSNIAVPIGVEVLTEEDVVVVRVGARISKEAEAQAAAEAAASAAASTAAEGAAVPAAGEEAGTTIPSTETQKEPAPEETKPQGKPQ